VDEDEDPPSVVPGKSVELPPHATPMRMTGTTVAARMPRILPRTVPPAEAAGRAPTAKRYAAGACDGATAATRAKRCFESGGTGEMSVALRYRWRFPRVRRRVHLGVHGRYLWCAATDATGVHAGSCGARHEMPRCPWQVAVVRGTGCGGVYGRYQACPAGVPRCRWQVPMVPCPGYQGVHGRYRWCPARGTTVSMAGTHGVLPGIPRCQWQVPMVSCPGYHGVHGRYLWCCARGTAVSMAGTHGAARGDVRTCGRGPSERCQGTP
jgi:hypothetical protein